jgi:hypothetical protein
MMAASAAQVEGQQVGQQAQPAALMTAAAGAGAAAAAVVMMVIVAVALSAAEQLVSDGWHKHWMTCGT